MSQDRDALWLKGCGKDTSGLLNPLEARLLMGAPAARRIVAGAGRWRMNPLPQGQSGRQP
ncbi:hypothetical protein JCM14124_18700 [Humidesulfovibrio idahonensis]